MLPAARIGVFNGSLLYSSHKVIPKQATGSWKH